jgi:glyoxylase-like metal-dependent hydrolase (beta-lactamase superfamily II)
VLVLDTHGHADHISGGPALAEKLGVPYYLHPYDGIHPLDVLPARISYGYLTDGQSFDVGGSQIRTIHIPGHTLGNVAFLLDDEYLFTGDSIFIESIARPDLGGHGDTWAPLHYHSLRKLLALGDDTVVLPAHFSSLKEDAAGGLFARRLGDLRSSNEGLVMPTRVKRSSSGTSSPVCPSSPRSTSRSSASTPVWSRSGSPRLRSSSWARTSVR